MDGSVPRGLSQISGWSIGVTTFLTSLAVLLLWIPLKQAPGIGTILNAVIIAIAIDLSLPYLPQTDVFLLRVAEATFGILLVGFGSGLYLIANLGPGPRDGLMTGLQRVTNLPVARVRTAIEITVVFFGWLLGGTLGPWHIDVRLWHRAGGLHGAISGQLFLHTVELSESWRLN